MSKKQFSDNYEDYKCQKCNRQMDLQEQQEYKERHDAVMLCWDCHIKHKSNT